MRKWIYCIIVFALLLKSLDFSPVVAESFTASETYSGKNDYSTEKVVVVVEASSQAGVNIFPHATLSNVFSQCKLGDEIELGSLQKTLTPLELFSCSFPSLPVNEVSVNFSALAVGGLSRDSISVYVDNSSQDVFLVRYLQQGYEVGLGLLTGRSVLDYFIESRQTDFGLFESGGEHLDLKKVTLSELQVWRC